MGKQKISLNQQRFPPTIKSIRTLRQDLKHWKKPKSTRMTGEEKMTRAQSNRDLLNEHDASTIRRFQKSPPVNVVAIAKAFGLKVYHGRSTDRRIRKDHKRCRTRWGFGL